MSIVNSVLVLVTGLTLLDAATQENQRTFSTPREAAQALVDAAAQNDSAALLTLLGSSGKDIVESGDPADDQAMRAQFAARASVKLEVHSDRDNPNRATIVVGEESWPFPVPLVRDKGKWHFDCAKGRMEILARRVGRNELTAIDVLRAFVEAQMEYASRDRDARGMLKYAQKIISSPGQKDGLYEEGEPESLAPKSFAAAAAVVLQRQGVQPIPYHGFYFHLLKAQGPDAPGGALDYVVKGEMIGGFALVAWPAAYGVSGVQTLMVNHLGIVYEKDLGPQTGRLVRQMTRFNPDKTWKPLSGE